MRNFCVRMKCRKQRSDCSVDLLRCSACSGVIECIVVRRCNNWVITDLSHKEGQVCFVATSVCVCVDVWWLP